jgi:hypothetical protein
MQRANAGHRVNSKGTGRLDFGELPERPFRRGLRLVATGGIRGPEKYRILDLNRRRAQIRARRALELS